ncbi:hypothetical protein [Streptomyces sp. Wh19]|uniref:hypothetical protein n=1 Tax=Streptomyces sp. Wh19 TaxID=3076629 RepID=UPI00295883F2|nr:hypothetical protein [Streptomyces sp. Wh19]
MTVSLASAGCEVTAVEPGLSPAAVTAHHVAGGSEEFFEQVKRCQERRDPAGPGHRALAPAPLNGLFGPSRGLIDDRPAGRITKWYPHELLTVRKAL